MCRHAWSCSLPVGWSRASTPLGSKRHNPTSRLAGPVRTCAKQYCASTYRIFSVSRGEFRVGSGPVVGPTGVASARRWSFSIGQKVRAISVQSQPFAHGWAPGGVNRDHQVVAWENTVCAYWGNLKVQGGAIFGCVEGQHNTTLLGVSLMGN